MRKKKMKFIMLAMCLIGMLAVTGCEMINEDGSLNADALGEAFQEALGEEFSPEVTEEIMGVLEQVVEAAESTATEDEAQNVAEVQDATEVQVPEEETETVIDFALYEHWHSIVGYWNAAEGRFAVPDMEDSHTAVFRYGMWDTEFATDYGRVIGLTSSKEGELTAIVEWDGGAQETVIVDYSGLEQDGKIRIKIGNEDWMHYMYAGATQTQAYETYIDNTFGGTVETVEDSYWPECEYTDQLAKPSLAIASATVESDRMNIVFADSVSHADIVAYATTLQDAGFNIDMYIDARAAGDTPRYSFSASNANGYYAELYSNGTDKTLCIRK